MAQTSRGRGRPSKIAEVEAATGLRLKQYLERCNRRNLSNRQVQKELAGMGLTISCRSIATYRRDTGTRWVQGCYVSL